MSTTYQKPFLCFVEQLQLLKARGLRVSDETSAIDYLRRIGYYRLSAYWYPFRETSLQQDSVSKKLIVRRNDQFIEGARFQDAVDLYVFDKRLRLLLLDAIERIEIAVRVDIAHLLGEYDAFAHTNPVLLHGNFTKKIKLKTGTTGYSDWIKNYNDLVARSKEDFVKHYCCKYGGPLPIWIAVELWDFGLLSNFYQGMAIGDKERIAAKYGLHSWKTMASWLRTINHVRNIAAHHSRLWNKNLVDQPKMPEPGEITTFDRLVGNTEIASRVYGVLCILAHLMQKICPNSSWRSRLKEMVKNFPHIPNVSAKDMGCPSDWIDHAFWSDKSVAVLRSE